MLAFSDVSTSCSAAAFTGRSSTYLQYKSSTVNNTDCTVLELVLVLVLVLVLSNSLLSGRMNLLPLNGWLARS